MATCVLAAGLAPPAGAGDAASMLRAVETQAGAVAVHEKLAAVDLADLFGILVVGTIPLPGVDPEGAAFGARVSTALTGLQRQCALNAIAARPPASLRRFLAAQVTPEESRSMRKTALLLLAPIAGSRDLAYGVSLVDGDLPRLARDFESFVSSTLTNDDLAHSLVKEMLRTSDTALRATLIRGVGAAGSERGLALLDRFLYADDPNLELLLCQIARLARVIGQVDDEALSTSVRHFLTGEEPGIVGAAARAAGALGDTAAIPELIALLDHESGTVRGSVKDSLTELTGLRFATRRRWFLWYDSERAWWDTRWPSLAPALRTATRDTITSLLAESIGKRLERDLLAREVAALLDHDDELVRRLACQSLGQLGTAPVIPDLLSAMSDVDEAVAMSAWASLCDITRLDLPNDPSACSQILEEARDR